MSQPILDRLRARLIRRVVAHITERTHSAELLTVDELPEQVARMELRVDALERSLLATLDRVVPPEGPVHADLTLDNLIRRPGVREVLRQHGLPDCSGCSVRHDETLQEAIDAYQLDGEALLAALQALPPPGSQALDKRVRSD